jgi:hypothetical protein
MEVERKQSNKQQKHNQLHKITKKRLAKMHTKTDEKVMQVKTNWK